MAHFCIEKLKSAHPNNNQDCNNAASIYPATILTTGWTLYTNVSNIGYQDLEIMKSISDHYITAHSPRQATKYLI